MTEPRFRAPMRSPLGRAIGLGSAKEGVEHWWALRVTSIALVPLAIWFVVTVIELAGADRPTLIACVRHPVWAVVFVLLLIATFYHSALGLQVVIEDYVENEAARLGLIIAMRLAHVLLAVLGIFAVLKLALGG
jgi:succinate dehydrogenase / fumarate reductase membrane anchor subunit